MSVVPVGFFPVRLRLGFLVEGFSFESVFAMKAFLIASSDVTAIASVACSASQRLRVAG
jgi:hypothetical protein